MAETTCAAGQPDLVIVQTTCPDAATAERIARALLDERLVACANLVPGVRSIYRWEGTLECADEVLLQLKTTAARSPAVQERVAALHPYTVPAVVTIALGAVNKDYAAWVAGEVSGTR